MKPYGSIAAIIAALEAGAGMFMREDVELLVQAWRDTHEMPQRTRRVYHAATDSYIEEKY